VEQYQIPPSVSKAVFKAELAQIPLRHRDDAVQEAWLVHLEGGDATAAMKRWSRQERRREKRARIDTNSEGEPIIIEQSGKVSGLDAAKKRTAPRQSKSAPHAA
jgi:hypothetical protein